MSATLRAAGQFRYRLVAPSGMLSMGMRQFHLPKIYPITDVRLSGLTHAQQVARFGAAGATLVQLREKHLSPREFYSEAEQALGVARAVGVRLIINDRVDIALALRADGVHLGQDDLSPEDARRLLGEEAIIGFSTHSIEQALDATRRQSVNYIALGPIYQTTSKENPDPVVGLDGLRRARSLLPPRTPLVAIGGINRATARATLAAGADALALIGALLAGGGDNIQRRMRELLLPIE